MILIGSQRGGASNLARHLLNAVENEHVTVQELRGFVANDLHGALAEAQAISKATQCNQFMFSLSLNPPKRQEASLDAMLKAADKAETTLGLKGQPRAVVMHEKKGRRHIHVVWSRIDADSMKAVNLPFFKQRLAALSKELYLEHGWELPERTQAERLEKSAELHARRMAAGTAARPRPARNQADLPDGMAAIGLDASLSRRSGRTRLLACARRPSGLRRDGFEWRGVFGVALDRREDQRAEATPWRP